MKKPRHNNLPRKTMRRKFDPDIVERAWQMRRDGWKYASIASELRVSVFCLHDWFGIRTRIGLNMRMLKKYGAP